MFAMGGDFYITEPRDTQGPAETERRKTAVPVSSSLLAIAWNESKPVANR